MDGKSYKLAEAGRYLQAFHLARSSGADSALFRAWKRLAMVHYVHQSCCAAGFPFTEAETADILVRHLPRDSYAFDELILSMGTLDFRSLLGHTDAAHDLFASMTPHGIDLHTWFAEIELDGTPVNERGIIAGYKATFLSMLTCATYMMRKRDRAVASAMTGPAGGLYGVDRDSRGLAWDFLRRAYPGISSPVDVPDPVLLPEEAVQEIAGCFGPARDTPERLAWIPSVASLAREAEAGKVDMFEAAARAAILSRGLDEAVGAAGQLQRIVMNMLLCLAGCPFYVCIGLSQAETQEDVPRMCVAIAEQVIAAFRRYDELLDVRQISGRKRSWWARGA